MPCSRRLAAGLGLATCIALYDSGARAQASGEVAGDTRTAAAQACVDQHVLGQQLLKQTKLLEARATLINCSSASCPAIVVGDCSQWLREVEQRIPSLVVGATRPDGRDAVAVRTFVDGRLVSERLDGRPIELDPGEHTLRFELAGAAPVEERVVLQDGHRGRRLAIRFGGGPRGAVSAGTPLEPDRPTPPLFWVLGGVGVVGLAGFGAFGIVGLDQRSSLDACRPDCTDDQIDDGGRRSFLIADISLGVGAAALVAATIVYLARPSASPGTRARAGTPRPATAFPF